MGFDSSFGMGTYIQAFVNLARIMHVHGYMVCTFGPFEFILNLYADQSLLLLYQLMSILQIRIALILTTISNATVSLISLLVQARSTRVCS